MKKLLFPFVGMLLCFAPHDGRADLVPTSYNNAARASRGWNFTVTLDGDDFGTHTFIVAPVKGRPHAWHVTSKADYAYTILGVGMFRYHHTADEEWKNGCLSRLTASTDHDGDISHVTAEFSDAGGTITVTKAGEEDAATKTAWQGCLMNFAYWNPKMREQTRLLDPETGEIEPVAITQLPDENVTVRGQVVTTHVWHVVGTHDPVDILYDDKDNWVGLDAKVRGGRALSYRLQ